MLKKNIPFINCISLGRRELNLHPLHQPFLPHPGLANIFRKNYLGYFQKNVLQPFLLHSQHQNLIPLSCSRDWLIFHSISEFLEAKVLLSSGCVCKNSDDFVQKDRGLDIGNINHGEFFIQASCLLTLKPVQTAQNILL